MFFSVNIFISTEDDIAEKLLLSKINLSLFTTYWLSWYDKLINTYRYIFTYSNLVCPLFVNVRKYIKFMLGHTKIDYGY